jgi:hypothetical protein
MHQPHAQQQALLTARQAYLQSPGFSVYVAISPRCPRQQPYHRHSTCTVGEYDTAILPADFRRAIFLSIILYAEGRDLK